MASNKALLWFVIVMCAAIMAFYVMVVVRAVMSHG